jgi:hypothetical protein
MSIYLIFVTRNLYFKGCAVAVLLVTGNWPVHVRFLVDKVALG